MQCTEMLIHISIYVYRIVIQFVYHSIIIIFRFLSTHRYIKAIICIGIGTRNHIYKENLMPVIIYDGIVRYTRIVGMR